MWGEYKFWYEQISSRKNKYDNKNEYYHYFDKYGVKLLFVRYGGSKKFEKWNGGDVYFNEYWELLNKDSIDIGGRVGKIEKINNDEFIKTYVDSQFVFIAKYIAAPDSLIPKEFRKLHNGRKGYNYSNEYKK